MPKLAALVLEAQSGFFCSGRQNEDVVSFSLSVLLIVYTTTAKEMRLLIRDNTPSKRILELVEALLVKQMLLVGVESLIFSFALSFKVEWVNVFMNFMTKILFKL